MRHVPWFFALVLIASAPLRADDPAGLRVADGQTVAFLGDSITAQGWGDKTGYVQLVAAGLKANGISIQVVPAGIGGHKSNQMLSRLQKDVLDKKPDWMTLSCGVNDVWHGERGVNLPDYQKNITAIVDRAQAAGVQVMILTATMIHEDQENEMNQNLLAYNTFLRELAAARKLPLADVNADMQQEVRRYHDAAGNKPERTITRDGVHMAGLGNRLMARGILRAFGLDAAQMATAEAAWQPMPARYTRQIDITFADELKLNQLTPEAEAELQTALQAVVRQYAETGARFQATDAE